MAETGTATRQRWALAALAILVAVLGLLLYVWTRPDRDGASAQPAAGGASAGSAGGGASATASGSGEARPALDDPETLTSEPPRMAGGQPFWRPGLPHWYGPRADPFIRQPHDYPPTTPEKLGTRVSVNLFDLERVQDMVRRGLDGESEIARALGHPLSDEQREKGRAVIQRFFDDTVPDIDAVLSGHMSTDEAYARIAPRRSQMDVNLRNALGLTPAQFTALWPHTGPQPSPASR